MEATAKFELFAGYMNLEPAEEHRPSQPSHTHSPGVHDTKLAYGPDLPADPTALTPCGSSPVELRNAINASSNRAGASPSEAKKRALGISYATMPGSQRMSMLKTLLTSACERDCFYCPFRAGRNFQRATFKPDEMAKAFMQLHRSGAAEGLFLSSGIAGGGVRTQDQLIDTAEILRHKLNFQGYLHLKMMPGADRDQVERSMQLANRVSINLEAPNPARLAKLAPHKQFYEELLRPLQWVEEIRSTHSSYAGWNGRWPSTVTQLVVGGADESDLEIMSVSAELYKRLRLSRVYYSAFHPVSDTPLENHRPENPLRQFRLYQSSFLLRDYGFDMEELPFSRDGNLPLEIDPKIAWAHENLRDAPIDVNLADRLTLLRIPGIGPKSADDILSLRHKGKLHSLRDLQKIGIIASRAAPFVLLDGKRPSLQLSLW